MQIKRNLACQNQERKSLLIQIAMKHSGRDVIKNLPKAEERRSEEDITHRNQIAHQTRTLNLLILIVILIHIHRHLISVAQVMTGVGERNIQRGINTSVEKGKGTEGVIKGAEGEIENQSANPRGS